MPVAEHGGETSLIGGRGGGGRAEQSPPKRTGATDSYFGSRHLSKAMSSRRI